MKEPLPPLVPCRHVHAEVHQATCQFKHTVPYRHSHRTLPITAIVVVQIKRNNVRLRPSI